MNREILFRGKRVDNGEWVYGYLVKRPSACYIGVHNPWSIIVPPNDPDDRGGEYWIDPETIGQYTGLTDNHGTKIFEGDAVAFEDAVADYEGYHDNIFINRGEVTYTERGMCIYFTNREVVVMDDLFYKGTADCEVIGNIFDNPELLGENNT